MHLASEMRAHAGQRHETLGSRRGRMPRDDYGRPRRRGEFPRLPEREFVHRRDEAE